MWERFTYYGFRALLILFMTADIEKSGGMGMDVVKAGAIYGLFTSMVYMTALPGGWLADKFFGQRKAVLIGGIIIAIGSFIMVIHSDLAFYAGLILIVFGIGLLKPNVSSMVGSLYGDSDTRRDAGFSIFYMGINLGALIAPLIVGYIGQKIDWRLGFGAAGVGMIFGITQYVMGWKYLGDAGLRIKPATEEAAKKNNRTLGIVVAVTVAVVAGLYLANSSGAINISFDTFITAIGVGIIVLPIIFFTRFFMEKDFTSVERRKIAVVAILFIFTSLFWGAFEQAGSTLNLFADRLTDCTILGYTFPSSWMQSVNSIFIIALAPVFAWLWIRLGKREPSSPAKFSMGLFFVGAGFALLIPAALILQSQGGKVGPWWLIGVYLLHTFGELSLSPVGLSMVTKLAPPRIVGQMMGIWFMTISLGNYIGGRVAGLFESLPLPSLFGAVAGTTLAACLILAVLVKPIKRLMGGVN
jgi:POT family proton-dependent oligopeptide transporter